MAKDEELMPPPSSALKQDHTIHFENSTRNFFFLSIKMYSYCLSCFYLFFFFLEMNEVSIPKLGNQKFSTLAELLQEQNNSHLNISQSSMFNK